MRIACNVSHQGPGVHVGAATKAVSFIWTQCGTNVSLGRQGRQGGRLNLGDTAWSWWVTGAIRFAARH